MTLEDAKGILMFLLKKVNHDESDPDSRPGGISNYDLRLMARGEPVREIELTGNSEPGNELYCFLLFDPESGPQPEEQNPLPPSWQIYVKAGEIEHQVWANDEQDPSGQKCEVVSRGEAALMTLMSLLKNTSIAPRGKKARQFVNVLELLRRQ